MTYKGRRKGGSIKFVMDRELVVKMGLSWKKVNLVKCIGEMLRRKRNTDIHWPPGKEKLNVVRRGRDGGIGMDIESDVFRLALKYTTTNF